MSALDLLWIAPVMLLLLALKGFFSGSEIALVNADKIVLGHRSRQGSRGAALVLELLERPERLLTTTLIGTNLCTVVLTTLGTLAVIHFAGAEAGDLYAFLLLTPLLLILGEIVPKSVYQEKADTIAPVVIFPLRAFSLLLAPIVWLFARVARLAARLAGRGAAAPGLFVTRQQLRAVMQMAERGAGSQVFDRFRIERAVRFPDTTVGEKMVPISEVVSIDREAETAQAMELVRRKGHTHLLAYEGNVSNVIGIATLTPWDMLDPAVTARPLAELVRPALFVSPQQTLDELVAALREREDGLAVVVDEFGSAIGAIEMDDVFESVVGEIDVGYGFAELRRREVRLYERLEDGGFRMDGRMPISEMNDLLELDVPTSEFHTVGGMVSARLRRLARSGDAVVVHGFRFTVEEAGERAIRRLRVEPESGAPAR